MTTDGWKRRTIGDLFDVQLGKMLSEKAKQGQQYPYLANFNVRWGKFDLSSMNEMHFSEREREKYALRYGDLLMCEGGEIGRCAIWREYYTEIYYQKALHRIRPVTKEGSVDYLLVYMQFIAERSRLTRLVGETSIAHLTREKLLGLSILFPPIPEQKAIADLLSTWDEAIEKTERLIQAKEKRFKWLLSNFICSAASKRRRILDFAKEVSTRNKGQRNGRVLSVTNHSGFVLPEEQFSRNVASSDLSNYKVISRGQYAYNPSRINVGSIARLDNWDQGVLSPMYIVFSIDESTVESDYFLHWLSSHEAQQRIAISAQGSVRETVGFSDFGRIPFPMPDLPEQEQVAAMLNTAQQEINILKQLVEKYKRQKRGLMQKMLTGEWRVRSRKVSQGGINGNPKSRDIVVSRE